MKKKGIVFLVGVMLLLSVAPSAMAGHCWRCKWDSQSQTTVCVGAFGIIAGKTDCDDSWGYCTTFGDDCVAHGNAPEPEPLAAEFTVASVERLDEPQLAVNATLVAQIQLAPKSER